MTSPGAYGSPLRENQVGMFGDGASVPPTPPTNIRNLIAQKEKVRLVAPLAFPQSVSASSISASRPD